MKDLIALIKEQEADFDVLCQSYEFKPLPWAEVFTKDSLIILLEANCERLRGSKKELPKTRCINAENRLFGSCFSCEEIKGFNEALEEKIALYGALIKEVQAN